MFAGQRGSVDFYNRGVGNVLKKKGLDKRRVEEKIEGGSSSSKCLGSLCYVLYLLIP